MVATQAIITTPLLKIADPDFDQNRVADYHLLIEIGNERFRFCVLDDSSRRILTLEDYSVDTQITHQSLLSWMQAVVQAHPYLGMTSWKNVTISFNTPHFTLVPDAYFRKEYAESYFNLVRGNDLKDDEQLLHHAIKGLDARSVFATSKMLLDEFLGTYSLHAPVPIHQSSALIQGVLRYTQADITPVMYLYFEEGFMTIAIARQGQLLICNKFPYKTSADMAYFVVFVLDSLQLKTADLKTYLYGEITAYSEEYQLIKKFLLSPHFGTYPAGLVFGEAFENLPEHRYYTLFNMPFVTSNP